MFILHAFLTVTELFTFFLSSTLRVLNIQQMIAEESPKLRDRETLSQEFRREIDSGDQRVAEVSLGKTLIDNVIAKRLEARRKREQRRIRNEEDHLPGEHL